MRKFNLSEVTLLSFTEYLCQAEFYIPINNLLIHTTQYIALVRKVTVFIGLDGSPAISIELEQIGPYAINCIPSQASPSATLLTVWLEAFAWC